MVPSRDLFDRPLRSLRLSVTDRCNLRCGYCMPEESYTWLPKREILSFEEAAALVDGLVPLGVDRVRLPGGEPLLRRDVVDRVARLASPPPGCASTRCSRCVSPTSRAFTSSPSPCASSTPRTTRASAGRSSTSS